VTNSIRPEYIVVGRGFESQRCLLGCLYSVRLLPGICSPTRARAPLGPRRQDLALNSGFGALLRAWQVIKSDKLAGEDGHASVDVSFQSVYQ